ncbi:MAG: type II secretion system protein [Phycisphaerales bacterium]|nr:MAG: type II secretion system protein [Phycisphaerales bacterium]
MFAGAARQKVSSRALRSGTKGELREGFTLIELLVVMSIISVLAGVLMPALGRVRRKARTIAGMSNQRQIGRILHFYALDNDELYPDSVATIGTTGQPDSFTWSEPTMLTGYMKRSPKLHRSISAYLRSYIADASILFCPSAPKKYKYLQESWDAGDDWDNPDTGPVPDPVFGTYCFYWNYIGHLGGGMLSRGPTGLAERPGYGRVLVSDYFGYDHWRSRLCFGSCEKFRGAGVAEGTSASSAFWTRPGNGERAELEQLKIGLSACYTDGHVERYRPSDTTPIRVIVTPGGSVPWPSGTIPGDFYLPSNGVR